MALNLVNLDERTRWLMLDELDQDILNGRLYLSPRLSQQGLHEYPELLREAITSHNDSWLAAQLRSRGIIKTEEQRRKPKGGYTIAKVPVTAPDTLAEGEFNRFYSRAVCRRAIESGDQYVEVYRAKDVEKARPESQAKIGARVDAQELLNDLRTHQGVEPALGLPPGPNSGLSVSLLEN
jgi:hypothetical protein